MSVAHGPESRAGRARLGADAWRVVVGTLATCLRHRVTGLAAEGAFFAVLSLPPLIFGLAGSVGVVVSTFSPDQVFDVRRSVLDLASRALTPQTVGSIIKPTLDQVLAGGRYDVISIGFVLALWSGSRAMNVFVDTITIMYGLGGHRGIVRTRALSFALYALGLVTGVVTIPLVVAGPSVVRDVLPQRLGFLYGLYWPSVVTACICFLATLYHVSVPVRTRWRSNLPGAVLTLLIWVGGSALLRMVLLLTAKDSTSIYGPLAAPIAVLIWLYILAIAVLIGAAVNATVDQVWPGIETSRARELVRISLDAVLPWRGRADGADEGPDDVPDEVPEEVPDEVAWDVAPVESAGGAITARSERYAG